jgi:hypothetical protein
MVEKLFLGVSFHKKVSGCSRIVKLGTFSIIPHYPAGQPASIGMMVKIG